MSKLERPLILTAPKDLKYGTVRSLAATEQAYDYAWEQYQDCMSNSNYTHEDALRTAMAILVGTLSGLYNQQAEELVK
jgi:hypothetical protein